MTAQSLAARIDGRALASLLAELLACASPADPHRNKSNAGRWVTINAPRELVERARCAVSAPAESPRAEFELHCNDEFAASAEGERATAWAEIQHYAAQYSQDGPVTIYEVTRRPVAAPAESAENPPALSDLQMWEVHRQLAAADGGPEPLPERGNTICNPHPQAPHGFNRNASHNAGRYVCDCEGWMPPPPQGASTPTTVDGLMALVEEYMALVEEYVSDSNHGNSDSAAVRAYAERLARTDGVLGRQTTEENDDGR